MLDIHLQDALIRRLFPPRFSPHLTECCVFLKIILLFFLSSSSSLILLFSSYRLIEGRVPARLSAAFTEAVVFDREIVGEKERGERAWFRRDNTAPVVKAIKVHLNSQASFWLRDTLQTGSVVWKANRVSSVSFRNPVCTKSDLRATPATHRILNQTCTQQWSPVYSGAADLCR